MIADILSYGPAWTFALLVLAVDLFVGAHRAERELS